MSRVHQDTGSHRRFPPPFKPVVTWHSGDTEPRLRALKVWKRFRRRVCSSQWAGDWVVQNRGANEHGGTLLKIEGRNHILKFSHELFSLWIFILFIVSWLYLALSLDVQERPGCLLRFWCRKTDFIIMLSGKIVRWNWDWHMDKS